MNYSCLEVREQGASLWVTLNRPQALNALNGAMIDELGHLFTSLYTRESLRVVVLRGAGRAFCAGMDLKEHAELALQPPMTVSQQLTVQRRYRDVVLAMRRCPQPIIALVNGAACGGGLALVLATDVRIGTPTTRMNVAPIRIGFTACDMGMSYFLPRMIGSSLAAEYMLTGRFIDAARAREMGLVSRIVDPGMLEAEAQGLVDDMLRTSPLGLRLTKDAMGHAVDGQSLEAVIALEDRCQALCAHGEDFQEAMASFREKREPHYGAAQA